MILEVLYTGNVLEKYSSVADVPQSGRGIRSVQATNFRQEDLPALAQRFALDLSFMQHSEDIEISSHFHEMPGQLAFNFSIPYMEGNAVVEQQVFFIIKDQTLYSFQEKDLEEFFPISLRTKYESRFLQIGDDIADTLVLLIGMVGDYFADLTEFISKRIKQISSRNLKQQHFSDADLDVITELNFTNIIIKESLTEFRRILILLKRSNYHSLSIGTQIADELGDISVVAEHIQYNFDRLDDLKENITSKIDLEQNKIFKTLTVITACISLPTLIAGVYGMNFKSLPVTDWDYGYIVVIGMMLLSFLLPIIFFRWKRWF